MEFTIFYKGILKSRGDPTHKHSIRKQIHPQIADLWAEAKEDKRKLYISIPPGSKSSMKKIKQFYFVPLISSKHDLIAKLNITILSSGTNVCDIDNQLKTLFDSIRMPQNEEEIPNEEIPEQDEIPFHCLLEDDSLITHANVSTARLLGVPNNENETVILIDVSTRVKNFGGTWNTFV